MSQVEHHRSVVRDAQQKLQKHEGTLKELQDRSQILQQEINSLQEQGDAEKAASEMLLPPMPPPSFPPEDAVVKTIDELSGVQVEELQEGDEEREEVEEIDNGGGVGAFLAPARRKMVKKTLLKKASA